MAETGQNKFDRDSRGDGQIVEIGKAHNILNYIIYYSEFSLYNFLIYMSTISCRYYSRFVMVIIYDRVDFTNLNDLEVCWKMMVSQRVKSLIQN